MKSKDQLALVLVVLGLAAAGLWLVFSQSGSPSEERLESGGDSQASREGDDPESAGEGPREARVERPRHDQPVVEQSSTTEPASVVETPQPEEWQAALYGRVITKTGLQERPVAGAFVALCRDMADHKSMTLQGEVVQHTVTDEAGRYALEGIDTLTSYLVRVEHPEYASRFLPQVELRSKEARKLDILVQAGFTIEGSVTTQDGLPVVGAEVLVVDQTFRVLDQIEGVERRGYSDQNGAFSVANLTSGFKQVHARREGLSTASRSNVFVTSGASEPISLTMGEAASISGSVVGKDDGRPIAEVVVTAIPVATGPGAVSAYPSVATDASGRFDYGGLAPGNYKLMFMKSGYFGAPARTTARTGGEDLRIILARNAVVRGQVLDGSTGRPVTSFSIVSSPKDSPLFTSRRLTRHFRSDDGHFEYPCEQAEGTVWLFAEAAGFAGGRSAPLTIQPGSLTEGIQIKMEAGQTVRGRIVDPDGNPIAGAEVRLRPDGSTMASGPGATLIGTLTAGLRVANKSARSDADGAFAIIAVPAGTHLIEASCGGYAAFQSERGLEVRPGADVNAGDLRLRRGAVLTGIVRNREGQSAVGVTVKLSRKDQLISGMSYVAVTDADGLYRLATITPGIYFVDAIGAGGEAGVANMLNLGQLIEGRQEVILGDDERMTLDLAVK